MNQGLLISALAALLAILALLSLAIGAAPVPLRAIPALLAGGGEDAFSLVVREIRLPRTLLACFIGGALGMSGAALQGLFRNPLAEPGIIGISACAALGACFALYSGFVAWPAVSMPVAGILAALLAGGLLVLAAWHASGPLPLILAGAALNALAAPMIALIMTFSLNPWALGEIALWLLGSLNGRGFAELRFVAPFVLAGFALMLASARGLDALTLGEETARAIGMNPFAVYGLAIGGAALATGAATAAAGIIGFAGLVAPHCVRALCSYQPRRLLLPSAFAGALLVLAADCASRLLSPGPQIHLGVFTALFGAPFFVFLLFRQSARYDPA